MINVSVATNRRANSANPDTCLREWCLLKIYIFAKIYSEFSELEQQQALMNASGGPTAITAPPSAAHPALPAANMISALVNKHTQQQQQHASSSQSQGKFRFLFKIEVDVDGWNGPNERKSAIDTSENVRALSFARCVSHPNTSLSNSS